MDTTTGIAIYGAVISTIALGWNIYKQVTNGPKLVGTITPDVPITEIKTGVQRVGGEKHIMLSISNRGNETTIITFLSIQCYKSVLHYWRRKRAKDIEVRAITEWVPGYTLPFEMKAGGAFVSLVPQNEDICDLSRRYRAYMCVDHSMSSGPARFRMKPIKIESTLAIA